MPAKEISELLPPPPTIASKIQNVMVSEKKQLTEKTRERRSSRRVVSEGEGENLKFCTIVERKM